MCVMVVVAETVVAGMDGLVCNIVCVQMLCSLPLKLLLSLSSWNNTHTFKEKVFCVGFTEKSKSSTGRSLGVAVVVVVFFSGKEREREKKGKTTQGRRTTDTDPGGLLSFSFFSLQPFREKCMCLYT